MITSHPPHSDYLNTGLLIALPTGLSHGGVQSWAARLASNWATHDRPAAILAHGADEAVHFRGGDALARRWPLVSELSPHTALLAGPELPSLAAIAPDDLARMLPAYIAAMEGMLAACDRVLVVPTLLGDCTGLCLAAARVLQSRVVQSKDLQNKTLGTRIRIAGWLHSAFPYDLGVLQHFEQGLDCFAGVSEHLTQSLQMQLVHRRASVLHVPNGVALHDDDDQCIASKDAHAPLQLLYVGRLEDDVKRVGLLPLISQQLSQRCVGHELTIVGDGPAEALLRGAATPSMRLVGAQSSEQVRTLMLSHDALLLVSRSEGLSLSMLEAMAAGCCPVVTHTPSGAGEALSHGVTGLLVDAAQQPDRAAVAAAFADLLATTPRSQLHAMGERAKRTCAQRYSVAKQLQGVQRAVDVAFAQEPRTWKQREFAFSARPSAGPHAEARVKALLNQFIEASPRNKLLVHGTGKHTRELAHLWSSVLPQLVGFAEDDRSKAGQTLLGRPVLLPEQAKEAGATHVIISSRINQEDIWQRREVYEKQGVQVLRIYD